MKVKARVIAINDEKVLALTVPSDSSLDRMGSYVVLWSAEEPRSIEGPYTFGQVSWQEVWSLTDVVKTFDLDEQGQSVWKSLLNIQNQ